MVSVAVGGLASDSTAEGGVPIGGGGDAAIGAAGAAAGGGASAGGAGGGGGAAAGGAAVWARATPAPAVKTIASAAAQTIDRTNPRRSSILGRPHLVIAGVPSTPVRTFRASASCQRGRSRSRPADSISFLEADHIEPVSMLDFVTDRVS
jgi:hypothetical protein